MQWPAIMSILLIAMNLWIYSVDKRAGIIMSLCVAVYIVIVGVLYFYNKTIIFSDLVDFAAQYGSVQNVLLKDLQFPYAILLEDGQIIWNNTCFSAVFGNEAKAGTYLSKYIQELNRSVFPKDEDKPIEKEVSYNGRDYRAVMSKVPVKDLQEAENILQMRKGREYFVTVTLNDVTELNEYIRSNEDQKLVAGLIYIDNYDEVMESVEEVRQSLLVALIDRKINQYMSINDGIVKEMEKNKFPVLDEAKSVNIGNTMPATLSIGIGIATDTYAQSYNYARVAIDLALARGGDQAVIKSSNGITYFGGKREQTSKNTRVKARVKAEALREFITAKDQVIVMGHKIADVDSFGAAVGIYRAALTMEKKAYIVLNDITTSVRPLYQAFCESPTYPDDMFIRSEDVSDVINDSTVAVVVDTNKPEMTECPELLKMTKTIVVFDHHRQSSNIIENTVLSYIEPYASSSCEMVAEVLQYITDDVRITNVEANSMYAGIVIDTNNFMSRTGVRTFEAAAFLRRCGADITYVRKIFRDDMESYRAKAEIVSSAEVFCDEYAIARYENTEVDSPTIIGAQAANELLNIDGIKASFVLTKYNGRIYVSARAIDEVNVQIIMERVGGGGHMNTAGAQFQHTNMEEAIETLKETIYKMKEEGDI